MSQKILITYIKAWQEELHAELNKPISYKVKVLEIESLYLGLREWPLEKLVPSKIFKVLEATTVPRSKNMEQEVDVIEKFLQKILLQKSLL